MKEQRFVLNKELQQMESDVVRMASISEQMFAEAIESLSSLDADAAARVIARDAEVDALDLQIESDCLRLLGLFNPIASDLRFVGTVIKVITDFERIGDLAVSLARITLSLDHELADLSGYDIHFIGNPARGMIRDSIQCFVNRDSELALQVGHADDIVDRAYDELKRQAHERLKAQPEEVAETLGLLLSIEHIERAADHAVNIAERVSYLCTAQFEKFSYLQRASVG
jgi:phosphate transport system protein